jgi:hypothetical protein
VRYEAKIDGFMGAALLSALVLPAMVAITQYRPLLFVPSIAAAVIIFGYWYPQWYITEADALVVRAGRVTHRIPYAEITAVRPKKDNRRGLGAPLTRLTIEHTSGSILIGPKKVDALFDDLAAHAPQLSRQGQNLVIAVE